MKLIKTRICSSLSDSSLSHLMKIGIESPDSPTDGDLENIMDARINKCKRIPIYSNTFMNCIVQYCCVVLPLHASMNCIVLLIYGGVNGKRGML